MVDATIIAAETDTAKNLVTLVATLSRNVEMGNRIIPRLKAGSIPQRRLIADTKDFADRLDTASFALELIRRNGGIWTDNGDFIAIEV